MRYRAVVLPCVLVLSTIITAPWGAHAQRHHAAVPQEAAVVAAALAHDAPAPVRHAIEEMLEASATFRRQCLRLAAAHQIHIRMHVDHRMPTSWRARTSISRRGGQVVAASVLLPVSIQVAELIAHELEHVLEQVDGVDLAHHLESGSVWKDGDGNFETVRAITIGRRVAEEVQASQRLLAVRR